MVRNVLQNGITIHSGQLLEGIYPSRSVSYLLHYERFSSKLKLRELLLGVWGRINFTKHERRAPLYHEKQSGCLCWRVCLPERPPPPGTVVFPSSRGQKKRTVKSQYCLPWIRVVQLKERVRSAL